MVENKPEIEIADISDAITPEIEKKHIDQKTKHPQWIPTVDGQNLSIYLNEISVMKDFNGKDKHATLLLMKTTNDKYPIVSFFPNDVCLKQFEKFVTGKSLGNSFESLNEKMQELQGRTFNIMFKGEVKSKTAGHKPYKNYSVIEV